MAADNKQTSVEIQSRWKLSSYVPEQPLFFAIH